jgi:hypothetical protein
MIVYGTAAVPVAIALATMCQLGSSFQTGFVAAVVLENAKRDPCLHISLS